MAQYRSLQDKDFVSNLYLGKIGVATTDVAINILIVLLDRKNGNVRNQFQGCGSLAGALESGDGCTCCGSPRNACEFKIVLEMVDVLRSLVTLTDLI